MRLTIPKATVLGVAEGVSESIVDNIDSENGSPTRPLRKKKNEALYRKLLEGKVDHLSTDD
jgi:hypothetical protein